MVEKQNDIKKAVKFLHQTDLVKIEDILPFFKDFTVVDEFKVCVCGGGEGLFVSLFFLKVGDCCSVHDHRQLSALLYFFLPLRLCYDIFHLPTHFHR